jgi:hypothetical protein
MTATGRRRLHPFDQLTTDWVVVRFAVSMVTTVSPSSCYRKHLAIGGYIVEARIGPANTAPGSAAGHVICHERIRLLLLHSRW